MGRVIRASTAIGLLLVSSTSIFGLLGRHRTYPHLPPPEPVWVNGVMGVYNPDTGVFVPSTSPDFDRTCDLIQLRREQAAGYNSGTWSYQHHWHYYPSINTFGYYPVGPTGGASGARYSSGSSPGFSSSHFGSIRGGIGGFGHGFGGSHS